MMQRRQVTLKKSELKFHGNRYYHF
ncbi:MAG: hypothetical protein LBE43_06780 [Staphylococcus aureus]|nr:hypothetical protein [Staphylococcus aureus]